jgi:hypothetical protein
MSLTIRSTEALHPGYLHGESVKMISSIFKPSLKCVLSGFGHEVAENCAVLGYYAA